MKRANVLIAIVVGVCLSGCAHLEFPEEDGGLVYFEPVPYMLVTTTSECVVTGTVVMVPGARKIVKIKPGYGSSELSVTLTNGMITSVGQKVDTKVPETLTAVGTLGTAFLKSAATEEKTKCKPSAILFKINNGVVDTSGGTPFPISQY